MTYIIAEPCIDIKDKSCIDVCPVDCIHEFGRMLVIDPEECIDCGACEPECPVEAIFPEDALPDKWEPFVKINYAFPEGAAAIDPLVDAYATEHNVQNEPLGRARTTATGLEPWATLRVAPTASPQTAAGGSRSACPRRSSRSRTCRSARQLAHREPRAPLRGAPALRRPRS